MPRPRLYDDSAKGRLVHVAARLVEEEGEEALSARRIASETGTTTAGVYTLFGGMPDLRQAVAAMSLDRLSTHMTEAEHALGEADPCDRFTALTRSYLQWATQNPALYVAIFSPGFETRDGSVDPQMIQTVVDVLEPLRAVMADGVETGDFSSTGFDHTSKQKIKGDPTRLLTYMVWVSLHGAASLEIHGGTAVMAAQAATHSRASVADVGGDGDAGDAQTESPSGLSGTTFSQEMVVSQLLAALTLDEEPTPCENADCEHCQNS